MKNRKLITCMIILLITTEFYIIVSASKQYKSETQTLTEHNQTLQAEIEQLTNLIEKQNNQIDKLISDLKAKHPNQQKTDRGGMFWGEKRTMEVTAYDLSIESCGKSPSHPEYGITASGNKVKEWYTVAAGPELPFGTKVYIPCFSDKPNEGVFTVQDRGGAIKNGHLDIYMASNADCMEFGRKQLEVWILE